MEKPIVSVDTSFFIAQNYLEGSQIRELGKFCKAGTVDFVLTRIVYRELLNNFFRGAQDLQAKVNKAVWTKNIKAIESQLQFDPEQALNEFKFALDKFIEEYNVTILEYDGINYSDVMDDYFDGRPPFSKDNSRNKNEFPDAIILKCFETYLQKNSTKGVLISRDNGVLDYTSELVEVEQSGAKFIDKINRMLDDTRKAQLIEQALVIYGNEKDSLQDQFSREIQNELYNHFRYVGNRYVIEDVVVLKGVQVDLREPRVIDIDQEDFKMEVKASLRFTIDLNYWDIINHLRRIKKFHYNETFDIEVTISITRETAWFTKNSFDQYLYPLITYLD